MVTSTQTAAKAAPDCQDVSIVFARGSVGPSDAPGLAQWSGETDAFFKRVNAALGKSTYWENVVQLGDKNGDGALDSDGYPAAGGTNWVAFQLGDGTWQYPGYSQSVLIGTNELVNYLNARAIQCPNEAKVLGGFSQGADPIGWALERNGSDGYPSLSPAARHHIAYVALYGDPKFDPGNPADRQIGVRPWWVKGNSPGFKYTDNLVAVRLDGLLGARLPHYAPTNFVGKFGSWCDQYDDVCNGTGITGGSHTTTYTNYWIGQSASTIANAVHAKVYELNPPPAPPALFHGYAPDGVIIQSTDGNLYVAAGGRLFWFDQNNAGMLAAFRAQMQAKYGTTSYPLMAASEVHAVEVNRTSTGAYSPGSNMPADNTFMYEYGTTQQYVVKFEHPFAIGDTNEVIALGGQDRAVMVPPGLADLQTHPAQWVQNDLLLFGTDPSVWHYAGSQGFRLPGVPTRDCLQVRWNRGVTYMPASAWNYFPTHPTQQAACDFTHGQWLYGTPSNRQVEVLYGTGHAVQYGEVAGLGGTNQARPVSDFTIDWLMGNAFNPPEHHMFRAANSPTVYLTKNGQKHLVGSLATRDCLGAQYGVGVEVVPQSFLNNLPTGDGAQCAYEGKQLLGAGGAVDYVQGGLRHHVQNPAIRDCLIGRAGTGQPVAVDAATWNAYGQGSNAYCPYEQEPGLNFVYDPATPGIVWLVGPATGGTPGIKRHAGSLCVPDPYTTPIKAAHVFTVPAGETAGHAQGADWWPSGADCQALPG